MKVPYVGAGAILLVLGIAVLLSASAPSATVSMAVVTSRAFIGFPLLIVGAVLILIGLFTS